MLDRSLLLRWAKSKELELAPGETLAEPKFKSLRFARTLV
jgi:hypothetical protein